MRPSEAPFGGSRVFRLYPDTYGPHATDFQIRGLSRSFRLLRPQGRYLGQLLE